MIRYVLKQCKNAKQAIYGKLFAYPVIEETIDEEALSAHMASHNTPFSQGAIKGMLTDMVQCIHELLLEGKNVKLTNLEEHPRREAPCSCHWHHDCQRTEAQCHPEEGRSPDQPLHHSWQQCLNRFRIRHWHRF